MLSLYVPKLVELGKLDFQHPRMFKVARNADVANATRSRLALLIDDSDQVGDDALDGFGMYLRRGGGNLLSNYPKRNALLIDERLDYLSEGDVIRVDPSNASIR